MKRLNGRGAGLKRKLAARAGVAAVAAGVAVAAVSVSGQAVTRTGASTKLARSTARARSHASGAAKASGEHRRGLPEAAAYLGLSVKALRSDLKAGQSLAQVADASSGKSASGLIDALLAAKRAALAERAAALPQRVSAEVDRPGGPLAARADRVVSRGRLAAAAAGYLGVSAAQLRAEERGGRSLAQIADATSGKSAAKLIEALVAAGRAQLDTAVGRGTLGSARRDALLARLTSQMSAAVNETGAHRAAGRAAGVSGQGRG